MSSDDQKTTGQNSASKKDFLELDVDEQVRLINEALEPEVYPGLAMDGGGLEIMDIKGTDVLIQYHGACGSCAIGETSTLQFIEKTMQTQVDPRIKVVIVN